MSTACPWSAIRRNSSTISCTSARSSPVVGSSASTSQADPASANAIAARWARPPESWCGYRSRWSAGKCARAAARATSSSAPSSLIVSASWARIVRTGCRWVAALCGTRPILRPLTFVDSSCWLAPSSSTSPSGPRSTAAPLTRALPGSSPSRPEATTDLPQPLSPTSARTSPSPRSSDTSLAAATEPFGTLKRTDMPRTRNEDFTMPTPQTSVGVPRGPAARPPVRTPPTWG